MHEQAQLRARAIKGPATSVSQAASPPTRSGVQCRCNFALSRITSTGGHGALNFGGWFDFLVPGSSYDRPPGAVTGILLARADGETQVASVGQQMAGRVGFFLRVEDFDAARRRMIAAGVTFVTPPDETRGQPCGHRNSPSLHLASLTVGRRAGISSLLGLFVSLDPPPWCSVASDATVPTRRRPPS